MLKGIDTGVAAAFVQFEGRQTHPIAFTPLGGRLLALNTPDGRLSVFELANDAGLEPVLVAEIPVGLEPVSVRARTEDEVWVINEVSDSVSIVSLSRGVVIDTLRCPDEPADVVFAGGKAFISCARNSVLRVFDSSRRIELESIPLEGLSPRALAVDTTGGKVYAAFQLSGNGTTVLPGRLAPAQPAPSNPDLPAPPRTALIVPANDPRVTYTVVDHDIAEIAVDTGRVERYLGGAGTSLFDLVLRPGTDELWVANVEALNRIRFEPELRGHFADNRMTRMSLGRGRVVPHDLNAGVDYGVLPNPVAQSMTLAQPMAVVFSGDGSTAWVAAFGSDRLARVAGEDGSVQSRVDLRRPAAAGSRQMRGPRGLAWDERRQRLYVLNKLSNSITVVDSAAAAWIGEFPVGSHDPTPLEVKEGRGFLYDARLSGNGTTSCGTCHLDGDRDGLAWDLGDPAGQLTSVPGINAAVHETTPIARVMHPMKGPMMTQTLRGLVPGQLLHWRGDRPTLAHFNPTFRDLMGGSLLPEADVDALGAYLGSLAHHPNPNRRIDNTLPTTFGGGDPTRGRSLFTAHLHHCSVCHVGATGSDNNVDDLRNIGGAQPIRTPSLQTVYQRAVLDTRVGAVNVSGYGLGHDGTMGRQSLPTVHFYELDALSGRDFADVTAFLMCFDTGTAPAVGFSRTVTAADATDPVVAAELALLESQAGVTNTCDLVAHGRIAGRRRHFRFDPAVQRYRSDRGAEPAQTRAELLALLLPEDALTFLGAVPGSGKRLGEDRNGNGVPDADEPAPTLKLAEMAGGISIAWPDSRGDWVLEGARAATGPWQTVLEPRIRADGLQLIQRTPRTAPMEFFRLRRGW